MAEIFQTHYDIERDEGARAHKFTRWLGASVVVHAVFLAAIVYVPALRDTFSLARELAGFHVVSKDYKKTEVYERVTLINLAAQKLYYPAGYFEQTSQTAVPSSPDEPKFIASVHPTPEPTPTPVKPTPTPAASPSPQSAEETAKSDGKDAKPNASPSPATPQTAEEAERLAQAANVEALPEINTKPFEDLLAEAKKKKDAGQLDLSGTIDLTAEGDRQDDGSIANPTITQRSGSNAELDAMAKAFISALSDSKVLAALKGTRHIRLKLTLDDKRLYVRVLTEVATADDAERMTNGYNMLLLAGAIKKRGKDEEAIFKNLKLRNDAREVTLTLDMPRSEASALVSKLAAKNQTTTPSPTPGG